RDEPADPDHHRPVGGGAGRGRGHGGGHARARHRRHRPGVLTVRLPEDSMMHSNGRSLLVAAALTGAAQLGAQQLTHERAFGSVSSYLISIPIGDTRQFINDPSWLGLSWEGLWPYRGNMVVGAQLGVHDFYAENDGTVNFDWGAATGHQFRDLTVATVMGTSRWYLSGIVGHGTYAGIGAGFLYSRQAYQLGVIPQIE